MTIQQQPYTRQRDNDEYLQTLRYTNYTQAISGPTPNSYSGSPTSYSSDLYRRRVTEMYDVVTDDWFTKLKSGVIVNNPMEWTQDIFTPAIVPLVYRRIGRSGTPYTYTGHYRYGTTGLGGFMTSPWPLPSQPQIDSGIIAEAITEAWSRVSLTEADLQVTIYEFEKTVVSLISLFNRALKIFRAFKKLDLRYLRKEITFKELGSRWLEMRYALRPLTFEAQGYVKAYTAEMLAFSSRKTFRSHRVRYASSEASNVLLNSNGTWYWQLFGSQNATRELDVRAGVLVAVETMQGIASLGLLDPLSSIWEMIPFSFILDWWFNIGKWIASFSPNIGLRTLASWYVVTDTTTLASTVETGSIYSPLNYLNQIEVQGTYSMVKVQKYRLPNPDRPLLPTWTMNMDWWKTLDLGLILKQLMKFKR